jgi:hypothetical protein
MNTYNSGTIWSSILAKDTDDVWKTSPPLASGSVMGTLTKPDSTDLGKYNALMVWDVEDQKYRIVFLNTGCATGVKDEKLEFQNYSRTVTPVPSYGKVVSADLHLTQCPTGLSISLRAREPHTTPTIGLGTLTDGFYQNGCNYDNLDIQANVILNLPPTTLCTDIALEPVRFTIVSGGARFLDSSGNPTLTTVNVNTDSSGKAITGIKLLGSSLSDVVISAYSTYGSSPVYTATVNLTMPVGPPHIVFAYRDSCYTDLLSPANGIRNGDYVYVEVRDCNRNISTGSVDTTTATVYEALGSTTDSETVTLTETGNSTGVFRGRIRSRALPLGWTPTASDGVLDLPNAGLVDVRYQDGSGNVFLAYADPGPYIPGIVDLCDGGIKFLEVFANTSYSGLTSDMTNFPVASPASWRAFSTVNMIRRTTTPTVNPSGSTVKKFMLQFCDELYLSGSIFTKFFYNGTAVSVPPSSVPDGKWRNGESFMWVDLDESVVGTAGSEKNWGDLVASYRFKYLGNPDDSGYGTGPTITIPDSYLPGVNKAVCFFFRGATSSKTLTPLYGSPSMDMIDRGYIAVWTKDTSGNPVAKLFRVDGVDITDNPPTMDVVQVGGDITIPNFNIQYDSPGYHKAEIMLEGNDFYVYFDDTFLDFDGESGPSAVGGASAIDRNYTTGTIGFGVKDVFVKFDNIQVCGCAPMKITSTSTTFPTGTPVTLTMKDTLYDANTMGPVSWTVTPDTSGTFNANPSSGAAAIFTRNAFGLFPDQFDAVDALGCVATFLTTRPPATCLTQNFESYANNAVPTDFSSCVGTWYVRTDASKALTYNGTVGTTIRLIRASATTYQAIWTNSSVDLYDDYTADVNVRPTNTATLAALTFRNSNATCGAYYYLQIGRVSGTNSKLKVDLIYHPASGSDDTLETYVDPTINYSTGATYHLFIKGNGPTIDYSVDISGVVLTSGTEMDWRQKTGGPGFRLYGNTAYFDNFQICTLP